jgi:hypothetical protein
MTAEEFDRLQEVLTRNVKDNTAENRAYYFSGLIKCPVCGCSLKGNIQTHTKPNGKVYRYKRYRCGKNRKDGACDYGMSISENVFEKMMLQNIEKYMEEAKIVSAHVTDQAAKIPQHDIEEIHDQIDRLNYSWKTGKIRKVEQYEKDYDDLMKKLEAAEAERGEVVIQDFSHIEAVLQGGWKTIYNSLDDEHKRAFWRSFIKSIEIDWTPKHKEITRVKFF